MLTKFTSYMVYSQHFNVAYIEKIDEPWNEASIHGVPDSLIPRPSHVFLGV